MTFSALKHLLTWYFSTKTVFLYFYGQAAQTNKNYFLRHFDSFTPPHAVFLDQYHSPLIPKSPTLRYQEKEGLL